MLAVGLARASVDAGYRTYYTTAADLAAKCHRAALEGRWATTMRFSAGPRLLVIDEVGYLPLPAEAAAALFQVITQRYLKSSIVQRRRQASPPPSGQSVHVGAQACVAMSGHWLYDEAVDQPVDIVGLPYEFWFELAKHEGTLEAGESPALPRADGLLYYVRFAHAGDPLERTWVDSGPCVTVAAAVAAAEQRVPTPITWDT